MDRDPIAWLVRWAPASASDQRVGAWKYLVQPSVDKAGKRRPSLHSWERIRQTLGITTPLPEEAWRWDGLAAPRLLDLSHRDVRAAARLSRHADTRTLTAYDERWRKNWLSRGSLVLFRGRHELADA